MLADHLALFMSVSDNPSCRASLAPRTESLGASALPDWQRIAPLQNLRDFPESREITSFDLAGSMRWLNCTSNTSNSSFRCSLSPRVGGYYHLEVGRERFKDAIYNTGS